ncbi:MAG: nucleotidyltransferase domain-containing protein [Deltaproteobacteria bacterium]|jgi:predicted nucleotidyltransferase|nr:nucleotidyltransferase domain-containing protein [Deltaproteobacteria bacterium]
MLNDELQRILEVIIQTVSTEKIYLFGSHAYGVPNKDSDYDIFVVISDDVDLLPIEVMTNLYESLCSIQIETPLDIIAKHHNTFEERKQYNTLERKIYNEGKLLYERR